MRRNYVPHLPQVVEYPLRLPALLFMPTKRFNRDLNMSKNYILLFTSLNFIADKIDKEQRESYIPCPNRERSFTDIEFGIPFRNELTQKAIARECEKCDRTSHIFTPLYCGPDSKIGYFRRRASSAGLKNSNYRAATLIFTSSASYSQETKIHKAATTLWILL